MRVFINTKAKDSSFGYTPEQVERTMTVRELIEYLEQFEDNAKVFLKNDNGYTYGGITPDDLEEDCEGEE